MQSEKGIRQYDGAQLYKPGQILLIYSCSFILQVIKFAGDPNCGLLADLFPRGSPRGFK